jgi:two-component system, cell cycle sensor histidine kinase and response regulator CckA
MPRDTKPTGESMIADDTRIPKEFFQTRPGRGPGSAGGTDSGHVSLQRASEPPASQKTVLLVEDNDAVRLLTHRILENDGYLVLDAASGQTALAVAQRFEGDIDLLIADVVMPQMRGDELAVQLLARRSQVRVLYMSGFTDNATLPREVLDGIVPFLPKPFTPSALMKKVRAALDGGPVAQGIQAAQARATGGQP